MANISTYVVGSRQTNEVTIMEVGERINGRTTADYVPET